MKKSKYLFALALGASTLTYAQVGIGTTSPSNALDIETTGPAVDINDTGGGDPEINFQLSGTTTFSIGIDNSDSDKLKIGTTAPDASTSITIDGSQNVGIGNTSPTAKLDVDGSAIFNESGAAVDFRVEGDTEANLLFVDGSADKVGIGTSTPGGSLEVNGGIRAAGGAPGANGVNNKGFAFSGIGVNGGDDDSGMFSSVDGAIEFYTSGTEAVRFYLDRVGIGTTSPAYTLDVQGSIRIPQTYAIDGQGDSLLFYSSSAFGYAGINYVGGGVGVEQNNSYLNFFTGGTTKLVIQKTGDVGIGTITPAYELEVAGAIMLEDASAPTNAAGHSGIYSSSGELNAFDASGNSTVISPHHFSLVKPSEEMAWSFYSKNDSIGQQINVDMLKALRVLENVSGEKLVYKADMEGNEITMQETNISLKEKIEQQQAIIEAQKKEIEAQKTELDTQKVQLDSKTSENAEASSTNASEIEALKAQVQQLLQLIQQQESASVGK